MPSAIRSNASRTTAKIVAAGLGDGQALALAVEELQAELGLQSLHLMADGALGDAQLVRGSGEALVPRRGLKRPQRIQRWQRAAQSPPP